MRYKRYSQVIIPRFIRIPILLSILSFERELLGFSEEATGVLIPVVRLFQAFGDDVVGDRLEIFDGAEHERVDALGALQCLLVSSML